MTSRVVHKSDLTRALDLLAARGSSPAALDLLPGGAVRLHLTAPAELCAQAPAADDDAEAVAGWDEALL